MPKHKGAWDALGTLSKSFLTLPIRARVFPSTPTKPNHTFAQPNQDPWDLSLVAGLKHWNLGYVVTMEYKDQHKPLIQTSSPAPLAQDFARQQVSKQHKSHYHSSSTSSQASPIMVAPTVNKTNLNPAGLQ